ncbi:MAG: outer membrane beta-barrel protein [Flavobacteriaceae bacterium]|nr:outer membrane beta-barrel protein [Flavobacteriaceae bacterium]
MRKLVLLVLFTSTSLLVFTQNTEWGIKAGLNYNANGDYFDSVLDTSENPDRNIGFHLGLFGKIGRDLYFKPELVYTSTKSDYDSGGFSMKKIDAPLLVGVKVLGPIAVFGGPSLQYILDTDSGISGISINEVENDFSVGLNFGVALNFEKFGIDVRYERGFNENEATFLDNNGLDINDRLDTRPEQIILSLSLNL